MKKKLNIFLTGLLTTSIVATTVSLTAISCGSKKPSPKQVWGDFKKEALKAKAIDIVTANPVEEWGVVTNNDLSKGDITFDDQAKNISVVITRIKKNYNMSLDFTIQYLNNNRYDINDWTHSSAPTYDPGTWGLYRETAKTTSAEQLFEIAITKNKVQGFKWKYGTDDQITWKIDGSQKPEFDTFGSLTDHDASGFKGMGGKPTANDATFTVTAIISKKGYEGAYDADPIKATAQYKAGDSYKLTDWNFTQVEQLQSIEKAESIYDNQINIARLNNGYNFDAFQNQNWMIYDGDKIANKHPDPSGPNGMNGILNKSGYPSHGNIHPFTINWRIGVQISGGLSGKLIFFFETGQSYHLNLIFNFMFADGKNVSSGGTAFNYIWNGTVTHA